MWVYTTATTTNKRKNFKMMTNLCVLREQTLFHLICRITEINGHLGQIMEVTAQTHTGFHTFTETQYFC